MCLSRQQTSRRWNWDGDEIEHDSIVPSSRPVPGREAAGAYDIDAREFLVTENNAVVKRVLENAIAPVSGNERRFRAREAGAFDFRADVIQRWVADNIGYAKDGATRPRRKARPDIWQFPDETLHVRAGDCEDRALLLASLLLSSGISAYNVRVALGKLVFRRGAREVAAYDHAWVVYKRENGTWDVLEPVAMPTKRPRFPRGNAELALLTSAPFEYEPHFLFNIDHLWRVPTTAGRQRFSRRVRTRDCWARFDPAFAGHVHWSIIDDALAPWGREVVDGVRRSFTTLFGNKIADLDFPSRYDPIDHFDNCMIAEGWQRVEERLDRFGATQDLEAFGHAAHGIADFYAHTSYGNFAHRDAKGLVPFDPDWLDELDAHLACPATYDSGSFDLTSGRFSRGPRWGKRPLSDLPAIWNGRLVSGRYAHDGDSQSFFERFTWMPTKIWRRADFWKCAGVPHHEEIAVDTPVGENTLYSATRYARQFTMRRAAAVAHVQSAFAARYES